MLALRNLAQRGDQVQDRWIAEPIEYVLALASGSEQRRSLHQPQVLRGIGNRQSCPIGEPFHAAFALGKLFQDLEPGAVAERLRDLGEAIKQSAFRAVA